MERLLQSTVSAQGGRLRTLELTDDEDIVYSAEPRLFTVFSLDDILTRGVAVVIVNRPNDNAYCDGISFKLIQVRNSKVQSFAHKVHQAGLTDFV